MKLSFKLGRQGGGYETLKLLSTLMPSWLSKAIGIYGLDVYIIRYPDGAKIPSHVDVVSAGLSHHRINAVLRKPTAGGEFICPGATRLLGRIYYFRPDIMRHEVTPSVGTRLILSIGWTT